MVQPQLLSSFSLPAFGMNIHIIDESGECAEKEGELTISPPSLGLSTILLNKDHFEVYYAGMPETEDGRVLRRHGDQMRRLPNGYYQHLV